jgi:transketolase
MSLRQFGSPLEGHPTPRLKFVDTATGSLGQGLSVGLGMALGMKLRKLESRVFVLLGDSEMAEGQVWEAMQLAAYYKLNNLIAILDVNRLGQRGQTMLGWDLETYAKRATAFGWRPILVDDGHDLEKVYKAYKQAMGVEVDKDDKPVIIIAKTIKGKGVSFLEDADGWHGKALNQEQLKTALQELGEVDSSLRESEDTNFFVTPSTESKKFGIELYKKGQSISTREAYGEALTALGKMNPDIVALDAEVSNSTYSEKFKKAYPARFFEMFIAEQNMVSTALGLSKMGFIPFASTFAAFFTRTLDQLRMAELSSANIKLVGSHAGVFIGADGPSQMGLVDLSMMRSMLQSTVLYPADATATVKLTQLMSEAPGIIYLRTNREKTPVIYNNNEEFHIGGSKIHELRVPGSKFQVLIIAAGVTLHEALKAQKELAKESIEATVIDCYSVKPLDSETLKSFADEIKHFIVVEDHYPAGGLGEAVKSELANTDVYITHLAVSKLPRSGKPEELLHYEEIDATAIIKAAKKATY